MTKLQIFKFGVRIVVAAGVSRVVNNVLLKDVIVNSRRDKVLVIAGSTSIALAVSNLVWPHVKKEMDAIIYAWTIRNDNDELEKMWRASI